MASVYALAYYAAQQIKEQDSSGQPRTSTSNVTSNITLNRNPVASPGQSAVTVSGSSQLLAKSCVSLMLAAVYVVYRL